MLSKPIVVFRHTLPHPHQILFRVVTDEICFSVLPGYTADDFLAHGVCDAEMFSDVLGGFAFGAGGAEVEVEVDVELCGFLLRY